MSSYPFLRGVGSSNRRLSHSPASRDGKEHNDTPRVIVGRSGLVELRGTANCIAVLAPAALEIEREVAVGNAIAIASAAGLADVEAALDAAWSGPARSS